MEKKIPTTKGMNECKRKEKKKRKKSNNSDYV